MAVPILKQGGYLIATIQAAMTDSEPAGLQDDLMEQVGRYRARGIIVDVTALDVLDSFAARTLRTIAHMTRLRGAATVLVGIQPEVAFAMVQLGMSMEDVSPPSTSRRASPCSTTAATSGERGRWSGEVVTVPIATDTDIVVARQEGRALADPRRRRGHRPHADGHRHLRDRPQHRHPRRRRRDAP